MSLVSRWLSAATGPQPSFYISPVDGVAGGAALAADDTDTPPWNGGSIDRRLRRRLEDAGIMLTFSIQTQLHRHGIYGHRRIPFIGQALLRQKTAAKKND